MADTSKPQRLKPTIALAMGDPSGISLELAAKILNDKQIRDAARYIVVGDHRALAEGCRIADVAVSLPTWTPAQGQPDFASGAVLLELGHLNPTSLTTGHSSIEGGRFALMNFRTALRLAAKGQADAVTFTPFNKHAMRLAHPSYVDEIEIITEDLGGGPGREFNVLDRL